MSTVQIGIRGWLPSSLDRTTARRAFDIHEHRLALTAIGRLAEQKNYPLLLRVMELLPDALLLIAGDGPLRTQLESEAVRRGVASKVRFLGPLPRTVIHDLLAATDVLVQTSTFEGQGYAMLEALQAGLPVIAHDIPEQRETLSAATGTAGALMPVNDAGAWAAAIERLCNDAAASCRAREIAGRRAGYFTY